MGRRKQKNKEEVVIEEINKTTEEIVEEPVVKTKEIIGKVIADQLYVRTGPGKDYDHSMILEKNTEVKIDLDNSNEDFYKVSSSNNIDGYCMKKFIEIL